MCVFKQTDRPKPDPIWYSKLRPSLLENNEDVLRMRGLMGAETGDGFA
jgi:hypothetical protein